MGKILGQRHSEHAYCSRNPETIEHQNEDAETDLIRCFTLEVQDHFRGGFASPIYHVSVVLCRGIMTRIGLAVSQTVDLQSPETRGQRPELDHGHRRLGCVTDEVAGTVGECFKSCYT